MNNWKVIFATVVIFGAGVVAGGLLVDYVQHSHPKAVRTPAARAGGTNQLTRTGEASKPRPPELLSRQFLQQMDESLQLKPEQRDAIQKIINDRQNQMRKVVQDARLEIREALTPEQITGFDALIKRPFHKPIFNTNAPAGAGGTNAPGPAASAL